MDGESITQRISGALARIEAAAGRIEAAASAREAANPVEDPQLQARYNALRKEAGEALQQLDTLIGTLET